MHTTTKRCSKCRKLKPATLDEFGMNGSYVRSQCRACVNEKRRKAALAGRTPMSCIGRTNVVRLPDGTLALVRL